MLIVMDGVHGLIPDPKTPSSAEVSILPPPPADPNQTQAAPVTTPEQNDATLTDADRLKNKYKRIGESQGYEYGASPGRVADFNRVPPAQAPAGAAGTPPAAAKPEAAKPPATPPPTDPPKQ